MRDELYDALLSASDNPSTVLEKDALFQLVAMAHVTGIPIFRLKAARSLDRDPAGHLRDGKSTGRGSLDDLIACPGLNLFARNGVRAVRHQQVTIGSVGLTGADGAIWSDRAGSTESHLFGRWALHGRC